MIIKIIISSSPKWKICHCILFRFFRFEKVISQCQLIKQIQNFWIILTMNFTWSTFFQTHVAVSRVTEVIEATDRESPSQTRRGFYKVVYILRLLLNMITCLLVYDVDPIQVSLWWIKKDVFNMPDEFHEQFYIIYTAFNACIVHCISELNSHRVSICSGQPVNLELDQDNFTQIFTVITLHRICLYQQINFFFSESFFILCQYSIKTIDKEKEVETQIEGQLLWIFRLKYLTFQNNFMNTSWPAILKLKWFLVVARWWKKWKQHKIIWWFNLYRAALYIQYHTIM